MTRQLTDFAKVIAAIAVVGIHTTSLSENKFAQYHNFFSADFFSVFVNQWARFSVPLFLYLSAYGLSLSDKNTGKSFLANYGGFLLKRLPAILIPYLFCSALGLGLNFQNLTWGGALTALLRGSADYHLYFLVILTQCYLLFPLLLWFQGRSPRAFQFSVGLVFILVILLLYKTTSERTLGYLGWTHPGWHASFCIYWLPYFMLGILHGRRPPAPWGRFTAIAAIATALILVLHDYIYYSNLGTPVDYYNHFSRPSVALYAIAVIYALHSWARPYPNTGARGADAPPPELGEVGRGRIAKIASLAGLTFSVYLIHPQILRLLNWKFAALPTLLIWLLTVVITFLLVSVVKRLLSHFENSLVRFVQRALGLR